MLLALLCKVSPVLIKYPSSAFPTHTILHILLILPKMPLEFKYPHLFPLRLNTISKQTNRNSRQFQLKSSNSKQSTSVNLPYWPGNERRVLVKLNKHCLIRKLNLNEV